MKKTKPIKQPDKFITCVGCGVKIIIDKWYHIKHQLGCVGDGQYIVTSK